MGGLPHSGMQSKRTFLSFHGWYKILYTLTQVYSLTLPDTRSYFTIDPNLFDVIYSNSLSTVSTSYATLEKRQNRGYTRRRIPKTTLNLHQVFLLAKTYLVFGRNFESSI